MDWTGFMRKSKFFIVILTFLFSVVTLGAVSTPDLLGGVDLYLKGNSVTTSQTGSGANLAYFEGDFSLKIGNTQYKSSNALVKIQPVVTNYLGSKYTIYSVIACLEYNIEAPDKKHVANSEIFSKSVYQGTALVLKFDVTGQVYANAEAQYQKNVSQMPIYDKLLSVSSTMTDQKMLTIIQPDAEIPKIKRIISPEKVLVQAHQQEKPKLVKTAPKDQADSLGDMDIDRPGIRYPVNIASAGSEKIIFDSQPLMTEDGMTAVVITGRFYLWQQIEQGIELLELSADNAVVYYAGDDVKIGNDQTGDENLDATGPIRAIYMAGNVVMTEGARTLTASQLYYDFDVQQGLAVDSSIQTYDQSRNIPIYIRADKMRQVARNQFTAEDVTITTSEFANPQIKLTASSINLTDTTPIEETKKNDASYTLEMNDMRMKYYDTTLFFWPRVTTNLERPDTPIKALNISDDSDFGFSVESRWYLHRLLGLEEPNNVDATFAVDVYGDRGLGSGVDWGYSDEDDQYFGRILGYIIRDTGSDDLGRDRQNIDPEQELRGRFRLQHRQYLEDDWQLTVETSYTSDRNFIEAFYRNEFNTGKEQENIVHLKRTHDNQSLSILGKIRINDFVDKLEELPTVEHHLTGQSLFDDRFTLFVDSQISRYRQRYDNDSANATDPTLSRDFFTFAFTRAELDLPLSWRRTKIVPYIAGTIGYEDLDGFDTGINGASLASEKEVFLGEAGLRLSKQYWAVDKTVQNEFWNVNEIRHIINPHAEFAFFSESDDQVAQRDTINVGLLQRWQTKRMVQDEMQAIDWMRLGVNATFVNDDADTIGAANNYIWNSPYVPMFFRRDMNIYPYGITRDTINADYMWQVSDTMSILSDLNYDIEDGRVSQLNFGVSRYRYPDLSYYIGSRYLRNVEIGDEKGSHALLYALAYNIDPRYTLLFSQEYNFDYGTAIQSELTIIRKYHRLNWAITINSDSTLDRQGILISIWPEGIKELALGSRKYYGLTGSTSNY